MSPKICFQAVTLRAGLLLFARSCLSLCVTKLMFKSDGVFGNCLVHVVRRKRKDGRDLAQSFTPKLIWDEILQSVYGFGGKDPSRFVKASGHPDLYYVEDLEVPLEQATFSRTFFISRHRQSIDFCFCNPLVAHLHSLSFVQLDFSVLCHQ